MNHATCQLQGDQQTEHYLRGKCRFAIQIKIQCRVVFEAFLVRSNTQAC
jgi:hypothetical protein